MAIDYEEIVREIDDDKIKKLLTRLKEIFWFVKPLVIMKI